MLRPSTYAWQDALYGSDGFYRGAEGPAGHFATSAQGIPGVAALLAQAILAWAERASCEVVVDFACGRGELLTTIEMYAPAELGLVGVDVVDRPDHLNPRIEWLRSPGGAAVPPLDILAGRRTLVVAHEWLDVVPCRVIEIDDAGSPREVLVDVTGTEALGDKLSWDEIPAAQRGGEPGQRRELGASRDAAWSQLVHQTRANGAPGSVVLGIDYARRAADMPPFGTLTGFRNGLECPPVPDGSCDITSHVVLDGLDLTDEPRTQRDVFTDIFGTDLLDPVPISLASSDPTSYLERLSIRSALATATARGGLGDFVWFTHRV